MMYLTLKVVIDGVKREDSVVDGYYENLLDAAKEAASNIGVEYDESKGHRISYYIG